MGSGLVNATAWRVTRRRSLWGAAETACNSNSTVRRVVSRKRDAVRLKAVRRERRLLRSAFFQIKRANFMVESYHRLQPQSPELLQTGHSALWRGGQAFSRETRACLLCRD